LAEDVPELRVAPGSATLVKLPQPIVPRDGFKVFGGEGRIEAQQAGPSTIVLVSTYEIGPERIPLGVATIDGRRYPFLLVTRPSLVDIEVGAALLGRRRSEREAGGRSPRGWEVWPGYLEGTYGSPKGG
jgi:hypothetical protein